MGKSCFHRISTRLDIGHHLEDVEFQPFAFGRTHDLYFRANDLLSESEFVDWSFRAKPLYICRRTVIKRLAGTDGGTHRFLANARAVKAHVALHHLIDLGDVMGHTKRARQHAIRTSDAARLDRAMNDAILSLFDRICRTDARARRI